MIDGKKWNNVFKSRIDVYYDELKWLYAELYDNDMQAFDYFVDMLYSFYKKRNKQLKEMDEARSVVHDWFAGNDMLGMLMYTDCFAGSLKGVKSHLDYIEDCGVNYIHLMPLLESPKGKSDGGYAVSDFRKVEPSLGNMRDLSNLAKACHERGISVCLDFVMNHNNSSG